jgi:ribosome-interacting GTPase 1
MIDLPGIIEGAKDGRGRGRQVIAVAKTCHLIFIVLDVNKPLTDKRVIEAELEGFGIRINKSPPNITFRKKDKGGLNITSTVPLTHIDTDEIRAVMSEWVFSLVGFWCKGGSMLTAATGTRLAQPTSPSGATPPSTT